MAYTTTGRCTVRWLLLHHHFCSKSRDTVLPRKPLEYLGRYRSVSGLISSRQSNIMMERSRAHVSSLDPPRRCIYKTSRRHGIRSADDHHTVGCYDMLNLRYQSMIIRRVWGTLHGHPMWGQIKRHHLLGATSTRR